MSPERVSAPDEVDYARYFSGLGVTLNPNGPYNEDPENSPPITTEISGLSTPTEAALECATQAYDNGYFTFDLHFRISRGAWECVQYLDINEGTDSSAPASFHNVQDRDVACSFGYTLDFSL